MTTSMQSEVQAVLRDAGPLTVDEIIPRLPDGLLATGKNPKQTVRNAVTSNRAIQGAGGHRYVYLPTFVRGASVRLSIELAAPNRRLLAVGKEVLALLWPQNPWGGSGRSATIRLAGDDTITVKPEHAKWAGMGLWGTIQLPMPFWHWWDHQHRAGADAILISCEDGEAGRYEARAISTETLDSQKVEAQNARLREAAAEAIKGTRGIQVNELWYRLLARGVYHAGASPDPLSKSLFGPDSQFVVDGWMVTYRPDLTPAMRRLFGHRINGELQMEEGILRELLGLPVPTTPDAEENAGVEVEPEVPAQLGYRLKVSLGWKPEVWRVIEMLDNQTLEDLHYAIQKAFHWDDDHLWAFFLSNRPWDRVTEVECPTMDIDTMNTDAEPPMADEVTLANLELKLRQQFLYIFDFGDELRHEIEVVDTFSLPKRGNFPRITETHGKAPPQYERWD